MNNQITLYPVHCLISMYQFTNLYDTYQRNDWIFQGSGNGVIFQNYVFRKRHLRDNRRECNDSNVIFR